MAAVRQLPMSVGLVKQELAQTFATVFRYKDN
jgi:hypothetical protein